MDIEQYEAFSRCQLSANVSSYLLPYRFRKAGYQAIDRICDYYYSLQDKSVISKVEPGYLREHIPRL